MTPHQAQSLEVVDGVERGEREARALQSISSLICKRNSLPKICLSLVLQVEVAEGGSTAEVVVEQISNYETFLGHSTGGTGEGEASHTHDMQYISQLQNRSRGRRKPWPPGGLHI